MKAVPTTASSWRSGGTFSRGALLLAILAALCLSACAAGKARTAPQVPDLAWPQPPEEARIRYLGSVSAPEDLAIERNYLQKAMDWLKGAGPVSMISPQGVFSDPAGRLFVADTQAGLVHLFDAARGKYRRFPDRKHAMKSPVGIAVSGDRVFVSDSGAGKVLVFEDHGKSRAKELGEGVLKRPTGLALNPSSSELLVVDTLLSGVFRFDLATLAYKGVFSGGGRTAGKLHYPTQVAVADNGDIVVSDSLNFRVQVFSAEGAFLREFGGAGDAPGRFARPRGVAVDSEGHVYVVDGLFDNVQVFDGQGRLLLAFGNHGNGPGEFWLPTGIFIDPTDRIFVSDSSNHRVQVFQYLGANRKARP